ncbi:hypothetical protein MTR_1g061090 [Medicago truncatula]|uniref:Uncharacterized protein n=1 Tax=Medicago truncatula TaxID=3880 RepID=A0A072VJU1_MEDTR|nr:hypothetical protein MTR_1g061090 [Medicago truncatula]
MPKGFKIPDFVTFSGEDGKSTIEHIGRLTMQCDGPDIKYPSMTCTHNREIGWIDEGEVEDDEEEERRR